MATEQVYYKGDTIRAKVTFRVYDSELPPFSGSPTDPDGQVANFTVYNEKGTSLGTYAATRADVGEYFYDWTATQEGTFYLELKGDFSGNPQLKRTRVRIKFNGGGDANC